MVGVIVSSAQRRPRRRRRWGGDAIALAVRRFSWPYAGHVHGDPFEQVTHSTISPKRLRRRTGVRAGALNRS